MLNRINIFLFSILPISLITGNLLINLNIILINFSMLYLSFKDNDWSWTKDKFFKILIFFYFYIIFNSIYNYLIDNSVGVDGIYRSLSFLKFVLLTFALNVLIKEMSSFEKIIKSWFFIITIVIFDVFIEFSFGQNILGFKSLDTTRIISFFYDESVVGGYLLTFSFVTCAYFLNKNFKNKKKIFINIFLFIIPLCILVTGERSNFLKCLMLFFLIIIFIDSRHLIISKIKISIILLIGIFVAINLNQNLFIKQTEFFKRILVVENAKNFTEKFQNIKYFAHYDTALKIFKDHPLNGVGSKNFRKKCSDEKYFNENLKNSQFRCSTHPHQIHFEILSEQGFFGYLIFLYMIIFFIYNNLKLSFPNKNIFSYSANFYLIVFLIPILPGGGVFSSFNGALFWIIFAVANYQQKFLRSKEI